jgi:hypothetical protein
MAPEVQRNISSEIVNESAGTRSVTTLQEHGCKEAKIAIFQYTAERDNGTIQSIRLPVDENLSINDVPDFQRIIVVQLPRYIDAKLQPCGKRIQFLEDYLFPIGFPKRLLSDHIGKEKHPFRSTEKSRKTRIPSNLNPAQSFTATYYEARTFVSPWNLETRKQFTNSTTDEFELICTNTGHQIQMHEWHQERNQGPLMIVPRNCSFWCKGGMKNNWDGKWFRWSCSNSNSL